MMKIVLYDEIEFTERWYVDKKRTGSLLTSGEMNIKVKVRVLCERVQCTLWYNRTTEFSRWEMSDLIVRYYLDCKLDCGSKVM
jgi:hypothetical protein